MDKPAVGRAIRITPENVQALALLNFGVVPDVDWSAKNPSYFLISYTHGSLKNVWLWYNFEDNWIGKSDPINDQYFVQIVER